jgi:hypothetical protein
MVTNTLEDTIMENQSIKEIREHVLNIKEFAQHSKSMSIGGKALINNRTEKILKQLEIVELELMTAIKDAT